MKQQTEELQAALKRELEKREATNKLEQTKTTIEIRNVEEEAQKLVLKKKASTPEVQAKLGPFITPGYSLPRGKISVEKKPYSLSVLQGTGALDPSQGGMEKLILIAIDPLDKLRPRWKRYQGGVREYFKKPDEIERVRDVQNLLIELGPVLVEMGKLSP